MSGTTQRSNAAVGRTTRPAPKGDGSEKNQLAAAGAAPNGENGPEIVDSTEVDADDARLLKSQNELAGVLEGQEEMHARVAAEAKAADHARAGRKQNKDSLAFGAVGHIVLKGAGKRRNEWDEIEEVPPVVLDLSNGPTPVSYLEADLIKKALSGELGKEKQIEAQRYGLQVLEPAAPVPPFTTWDELPTSDVLDAARMTGAIRTKHDVEDALEYERSKPEPGEGVEQGVRTQRPDLVASLEALLSVGHDRPLEHQKAPAAGVTMAL